MNLFKRLIKMIVGSKSRSDEKQDQELDRLFGEISEIDLEELEEHYVRMESEDWADKTQAFIDNHDDIDCARATREWAAIEREVYHLMLEEVTKRVNPRSFTMEEARQLVQEHIKYDVPDAVISQQYDKLFYDLGI